MRLHLPAIPHTITHPRFSHCAFTGKVLKFPRMIHQVPGYEVIHYGIEGSETEADSHITIMSRGEQADLLGHDHSDPHRFVGSDANVANPLYTEFNRRLREALRSNVNERDIILLPFGHAHNAAMDGVPGHKVESGIGYPELSTLANFRVFESYAWLHWHQGKAQRGGINYEWVIPNYFDVDEWELNEDPDMNRIVYLGRLEPFKGLSTIIEIARHRPDLHFTLCGQGDPGPWLGLPNVEFVPPIHGTARSAYLGNARCVLMPTEYTEPFGGVAVEAMLCGSPVLTTDYGAFTETIEQGATGFRCHTLGDFLAGIELVGALSRRYIQSRARALYGFAPIAQKYDHAFQQINDLWGKGWYAPRSSLGPVMITNSIIQPTWETAQKAEAAYHQGGTFSGEEDRKRDMYAGMMGIRNKTDKVMDIGGGPESLLLKWGGKDCVVADPLEFDEVYERAYEAAGIRHVKVPGERLGTRCAEAQYNEVWIYNVLQHVMDPEKILRNALHLSASRVRIWEWLNIPQDEKHPHIITRQLIRSALVVPGWKVANEIHGHWKQYHYPHDEFYCLVVERDDA